MDEMSNPSFFKKKKIIISLSSAEFAQRVVKVKVICLEDFHCHFAKEANFGRKEFASLVSEQCQML